MAGHYVESVIIRQDNVDTGDTPAFNDDQCDKEFEFEGKIILKQIIKSV